RLLAKERGVEAELFEVTDEELAREAMGEAISSPSPLAGEGRREAGGVRGEAPARCEVLPLTPGPSPQRGEGGKMPAAFAGITLDQITHGPARLNLPADWASYAQGAFGTPT